jgi:hypothetical protein
MLVNQFMKENGGSHLRAEIHSDPEGYSIRYFINGALSKEETFYENSIHYVEDAAENWLAGIKKLNG